MFQMKIYSQWKCIKLKLETFKNEKTEDTAKKNLLSVYIGHFH